MGDALPGQLCGLLSVKWECECGCRFTGGYECPVCGSLDVEPVDSQDVKKRRVKESDD